MSRHPRCFWATLLLLGGLALLGPPANLPARITLPVAPHLAPGWAAPFVFEPNAGQTDPSVHFLAHQAGGTLFFTPDSVVFVLPAAPSAAAALPRAAAPPAPPVLRLRLLASAASALLPTGPALSGRVNYLLGANPQAWHTAVPTYGGITYHGLYPGIDLEYTGVAGQLKGTYTLAPGADPAQIHWRYDGAAAVTLDAAGNLRIALAPGTAAVADLTEAAPRAWQERAGQQVPIAAHYALHADSSITFQLGPYDHTQPLILDPFLTYSTFLGGGGADRAYAVAVDAAGSVYLTGSTASTTFPVAAPYQPYYGGGTHDAFVTKLNADATAAVYSTYLGGVGDDTGYGLAVNTLGQTLVTGATTSDNFPLVQPIQPARSGNYDTFISALTPDGTALVYSTYLGGGGNDFARGLALDSTGNVFVTGQTTSSNFPLAQAYQSQLRGTSDVFVTKMNSAGTAWVYSTYLGGSGGGYFSDAGYGIAVDSAGSAYVTGTTNSTDFPRQDPYDPTFGGPLDGFVTKFQPAGTSLAYSTYLGGGDADEAFAIAVDGTGSAYITGYTSAGDFPLVNPYQAQLRSTDAFLSKLNPAGSALVYSTFLGGGSSEFGYGVAVDGAGGAVVTGHTFSTDFPRLNPIQNQYGGAYSDGFVTAFLPAGNALAYSTFLGGVNDDEGRAVAVDGAGAAYVAGWTGSGNFPIGGQPFQRGSGGSEDGFVAKIGPQTPLPAFTPTATPLPYPPCGLAWRPVGSPNQGTSNALYALSAVAADDLWAVGESNAGTLAYHWQGTAWQQTLTGQGGILRGVAARAANDVWAVGNNGNATWTLHWDGASWQVVPSPSPDVQNGLYAVTAVAANDVWAVGTHSPDGNADQTLILHWNGSQWQQVAAPSPVRSKLYGIRAITATDIWAVGASLPGSQYQTVALHWNGSSWASVAMPAVPDALLFAVTATAANDVWAVGSQGTDVATLIEHWNGAAWSVVGSPNAGSLSNGLFGVTARTANDAWAVGRYSFYNGVYQTRTLLAHWDGATWSQVASPNPDPPRDEFWAVNAVTAGDVWAVGAGGVGPGTLTAHYHDPCFTPSPTIPPTATGTPPTATRTATPTRTPSHTATPPPTPTCPPVGTPHPWTVRTPFALDVYGAAAAGSATYAYVGGGYSQGLGVYSNTFARFNPATNVWQTLAAVPNTGERMGAVYVPLNNKIYLFGGVNQSGNCSVANQTRIYDIASNSWSSGTVLPVAVHQAVAGYWAGRVYLAGGATDCYANSPQSILQIYDVVANTWSLGGPLPQAVGGAGGGAISGHLYVAGGRNAAAQVLDTLYDYDIALNTWMGRAALPSPVNVPGSAVLDGRLWIFGGGSPYREPGGPAAPLTTGQSAIYDPATNSWQPGLALNGARSLVAGTTVGNTVVATGGLAGTGSVRTTETTTGLGCNSPSPTPSAPPTATAVPTVLPSTTGTPVPIQTQEPTATAVPTVLPSATGTPAPTQTRESTMTAVPTHTVEPTRTPGSASATPVPSLTATRTPSVPLTNTPPRTATIPATNTPGPLTPIPTTPTPDPSTATPCPIQFQDVDAGNPFFLFIRCLACRGIVNGYGDGTFRPGNSVTRGQIAKMVVLAAGFGDPLPSGQQTFEDAPGTHPFWVYIETLAGRGYISGYSCGGPGEPCAAPGNRPYFRPYANITRGQIAKVDANAAGYTEGIAPTQQTFADVPASNPFWVFVERVALHSVISGYGCGGVGEPCEPPLNRPYFRPYGSATRGQTAKIVANTFYPGCQTPQR